MSVGTISGNGNTIPFLAMQTPAGMIDDEPLTQGEELTTAGVNGRRWRTIFRQFPSFQMTTFSEMATYTIGAYHKALAEGMVQSLVRMEFLVDGLYYKHKDVHVSAVSAQIHPGPIFGNGAGTGLAHLEITWQMECTDFDNL